jgi:hypothetical protein
LLLTSLLLVEIISLRTGYLRMIPVASLAEPDSVRAIQAAPDWREYKLMDVSGASRYAFARDFRPPSVGDDFRRMLSSVSGLTPELWGIDGFDGALALPLARRVQIQDQVDAEIAGRRSAAPGARLIDILGIRFVALRDAAPSPAFRQFWHRDGQAWIMENMAALPRFQIYEGYVSVDSPEQAQAVMRGWRERTLVVEDPRHRLTRRAAGTGGAETGDAARIVADRSIDTDYRLDVSADRPCWLFLADANYPGWFATIDGQPVPLYSAQILGKAVQIPPGRHRLRIAFRSASFMRGAWISAISLLATVAIGFAEWRRVRRRPADASPATV